MKKFRNVVWEGRFQPFHRGHCEYVRRLLDYGERVWIYVVANEVSTEVVEDPSRLPVPEFTRAVDPHHAPSKNVLPLWLRCLIVQRAVASEFGPDAPISVSSGRRLAWIGPTTRRTCRPIACSSRPFAIPSKTSRRPPGRSSARGVSAWT